MTESEAGYCSGFVDGEGCIHIAKQLQRGRPRPTYRARLSIAQGNLEVLEYVAAVLGEPSYLGRVRRTEQHNRQQYVLVYDGRHACAVLEKLLPYLRVKAPEARVLLRYFEECDVRVHPGPRGHDTAVWHLREKFYKKLRRLK